MPRLDFYIDQKQFLNIRLGDGEIRVGRGADCQVQLPAKRVSRHHASIRPVASDAYEIENTSTNGTRLNAAMVEEPIRLRAGDRIYIDKYVIIYQPDDAPSEDLEDSATMLGG